MHVAASFGQTEMANALIKHGADIEAKNNHGATPLRSAEMFGQTETARALVNAGTTVSENQNAPKKWYDFWLIRVLVILFGIGFLAILVTTFIAPFPLKERLYNLACGLGLYGMLALMLCIPASFIYGLIHAAMMDEWGLFIASLLFPPFGIGYGIGAFFGAW